MRHENMCDDVSRPIDILSSGILLSVDRILARVDGALRDGGVTGTSCLSAKDTNEVLAGRLS